jgi:hypothetical protein
MTEPSVPTARKNAAASLFEKRAQNPKVDGTGAWLGGITSLGGVSPPMLLAGGHNVPGGLGRPG